MESQSIPELIITKTINAPRELVFAAWTNAEHLAQWWGPKGFTNPVCKADARPGGAIRIDMKSPGGTVVQMGGYFKEMNAPDKLVLVTTSFEDENGTPLLENLITVLFADDGDKTLLTLNVKIVKFAPQLPEILARMAPDWGTGLEENWHQSLDRLTALLK